MITNDFIRNRIMEIKPLETDTATKKEIEETLDYLFSNLYFFANLTVAHCFEKYQNINPEDIPYIKGFGRVKKIEKVIQQWHNSAASSPTEDDRNKWNEKINRLTEIKRYYRRQVLKKIFAFECRNNPQFQSLHNRFPKIPYIVAFNTFFEVSQQFLLDWPRVREGTRQLRQYQKGMPIYFGYDNNFTPFYIYRNENGKEDVRFKWVIDKEIYFKIEFGRDKSENETLLRENIIGKNDGYKKLGDSFIQIDKRKNKIFLNQVFKLEQPLKEVLEKKLDPSLILGVDLGIKIPLYWALSNGNEAQPVGSEHKIPKLRSQFYNRINRLQTDLKNEGAKDKGQVGRLKPLLELKKKESELIKQINRSLAKTLIEAAVEKGAGTIHIENIDFNEKKKLWIVGRKLLNEGLTDLQVIKEYNSYYDRMLAMFRNWSYSQLIRFIKEQAENYGIQVLYVDARYSSRTCFVCKEKGTREKQEFLQVKKDKECSHSNCPCLKEKTKTIKFKDTIKGFIHLIPADRNAAFNIACNAKRVVPLEKEPIDWATTLSVKYTEMQSNAERKKNKPSSGFKKRY
jgi:IS605 OrfB family transposase